MWSKLELVLRFINMKTIQFYLAEHQNGWDVRRTTDSVATTIIQTLPMSFRPWSKAGKLVYYHILGITKKGKTRPEGRNIKRGAQLLNLVFHMVQNFDRERSLRKEKQFQEHKNMSSRWHHEKSPD